MNVDFVAPLWEWQTRSDLWTFVSVPAPESDEILDRTAGFTRGFGSVRVEVTVGGTVWRTSVFPDAQRKCYSLPVKRAVRDAEGLRVGQPVRVSMRVVDL